MRFGTALLRGDTEAKKLVADILNAGTYKETADAWFELGYWIGKGSPSGKRLGSKETPPSQGSTQTTPQR